MRQAAGRDGATGNGPGHPKPLIANVFIAWDASNDLPVGRIEWQVVRVCRHLQLPPAEQPTHEPSRSSNHAHHAAMTKTRVSQFTSFNLDLQAFTIVPAMATPEAIAAVGGRKMAHSEQDVPTGMVDCLGFYPRRLLPGHVETSARARLSEMGFRPARSACAVATSLVAAATFLAGAAKPFKADVISSRRLPRMPPSERKRT